MSSPVHPDTGPELQRRVSKGNSFQPISEEGKPPILDRSAVGENLPQTQPVPDPNKQKNEKETSLPKQDDQSNKEPTSQSIMGCLASIKQKGIVKSCQDFFSGGKNVDLNKKAATYRKQVV